MSHDYDREYDKQCVHVGKFDPFKGEDKDKTPYWLVFKRNKIEFSETIKDYLTIIINLNHGKKKKSMDI